MSSYKVFRTEKFQAAYEHYKDNVKLLRIEEIVTSLEYILESKPNYYTLIRKDGEYSMYSMKPHDITTSIDYYITWIFDGEKVLMYDIYEKI